MEKIVVPVFAEGEGEPKNETQLYLEEMVGLVEQGRWCRDTVDDGWQRHCTQGLINVVIGLAF